MDIGQLVKKETALREEASGRSDAAIVLTQVSKYITKPRNLQQRLMLQPIEHYMVLDAVSLTIVRGELVVLLGENGAGKTTLLKLMSGLAAPDRGTVACAGKIAYCGSGDRSFYFRLSIQENMRFFAALLGLSGAEREKKIDAALETVDLLGKTREHFANLSSGMRQRLAIARALLSDPDILAFDEPTRAVDPKHAAILRSFIKDDLVQSLGKTVILATNLLDEAHQLADRIVTVEGAGVHITLPGVT